MTSWRDSKNDPILSSKSRREYSNQMIAKKSEVYRAIQDQICYNILHKKKRGRRHLTFRLQAVVNLTKLLLR